MANITLTEQHRNMLVAARESPSNPQYQLRVYCTAETYYTMPNSSYYANNPAFNKQPLGPAPVEFPTSSELKINNYAVTANLRGVKKKEGSTVPPDLGQALNYNGAKALDLRMGALNRVELLYINADKVCVFRAGFFGCIGADGWC